MVINLLSSPRNVSTALMYSFAQRNDTKVIDEPYYSYYLKYSGADHPGREEIIESLPPSANEVHNLILSEESKSTHLFVKSMAHHMVGFDTTILEGFTNIFLIRNPHQLIASFAKVIPNPTMTDIGLSRQVELYETIESSHSKTPVVLDSGELLKDPEKILKSMCEAIEILFDERMLQWPAGARAEDGVWAKYWYENVHKSTGFSTQKTSSRDLPDHCYALYEEAKPYYQTLFQHAIKA
ncbi:MAG: sulfotransferase family protein [Bacteroidota bacterium]